MSALTTAEQAHFNKVFAEKIVAEDTSPTTLKAAIDPKKTFCDNWETVAMALAALKDLVSSSIAKSAIGIVIAAGNTYYGMKCGK